jgi:hypothetical protein
MGKTYPSDRKSQILFLKVVLTSGVGHVHGIVKWLGVASGDYPPNEVLQVKK